MTTASLRVKHPFQLGLSPATSFWEMRVAPFLDKHFVALCLSLIGIACTRVIATYNCLSLTTDEPDDFTSGLEFLSRHAYTYNIAHPPLSRLFQALGPYLAGARLPNQPGSLLHPLDLIALTGHVERTIFLMRLGNLPFFILACLVVCGWSWHAFGKPIAVVATCLYTLLPAPLADAGLATPDMALGATVGAAVFAAVLWVEKPTWLRALIMGVFTAAACLSRFTALGYIPGCLGLALSFFLVVERPGWRCILVLAKLRVATLAFAALTAATLIWAGYWFSAGRFPSHRLGLGYLPPAPEFFAGVMTSLTHNTGGHGSYLLGHFSWEGWWCYFPIALAVKTPIAFLVLAALGFYACLRNRFHLLYLLPVAFTLGILLPALRSHIDIGIRHIEPIWVGLSIIASLGLRQLLLWARTGVASMLSGGALLTWMVISVACHHPDYVAYFNAFAGKTPEQFLVDSNYDWGQDLKLLAERLNRLRVQNVSLAITQDAGYGPPTNYAYLQDWYGLPHAQKVSTCVPLPGWNVVSTTVERSLSHWAGTRYYRGPGMPAAWYELIAPTERIGPLLLYDIPEGSKLRSENCDSSFVP